MTSWSKDQALPYGRIRIVVNLVSQSVSGNSSTFQVLSYVINDATSGPTTYASLVDCALSGSGSLSVASKFNLSVAPGGTQQVMSHTVTVGHASNGTLSAAFAASIGDPGTTVFAGGGGVILAFTAPTIARASQPTVSPTTADAGDTVTILTHRASTSFLHDLTYKLGTATGTIATGVQDYDWTIPMSILAGIPSATSGTCTITCVTKSGSTVIGTTTVTFTITADSSVKPTISSITKTEATAGVAAAVGGFVQKISTLALAIVGAAGAYGSTITGYKLTVDGQTVNAATGTTGALQSAGTLTITGTVTDSRGRTGTASTTVSVLPYTPPLIDSAATGIVRADSDGTTDVFNGVYLKPTLKASVQSLKPASTEKNTLTYRISTRGHTTGGTYTQKATATPAGVTINSTLAVFGTYDVADSWDVLIEVSDLFTTSQYLLVVPTGAAILDLRPEGVGVLKRWENGALDVGGDAYIGGNVNTTGAVTAAAAVQGTQAKATSTTDASATSTAHPIHAGPDTGKNIAVGPTKIQARNNGVKAALALQPSGGDTTVGTSSDTLHVPGAIDSPAQAWAEAAGEVTVAATGTTSVTFPVGRFTQAPRVTLSVVSYTGAAAIAFLSTATTTGGFSLRVFNLSGTQIAGTVDWHAKQMSSGAASG